MPAIISYLSKVGLALETTWGTAPAGPTIWLPFDTLKNEDDIKRIVDKGKRGSLAQDFASYAGTGVSKGDVEGMFYPDVHGYLLKGIFGQDTVTGAAAPYTHKFQLSNNQPPSFSLFDYDGINERIYSGCVMEQLDMKFTTEGELKVTGKFQGKTSTISGTQHSGTFGTTAPFIGFEAAVTIGGSANMRLVGGDLTIKRPVKFTFGANNSQSPTKVNVGTMEITGKLDFEVDDYTELNYYLNTTQPAVVITFTSGTNVLTIQMSKCDFEKIAGLDRSKEMVTVNSNIRGLYNSTDAGPGMITLASASPTYS